MNTDLAATEMDAFLEQREQRGLLRFITCGSVDDGKSTLIGRLLYECGALYDDQLDALEADSKRHGTQGDELDFALLMDGLSAEREQGITIDVAYRFFSTDRRSFIVADTPGHEQYTRNMVTGASTADCALILIDATKGVVTQTRRHAFIVGALGVRHVAAVITKMDLVDGTEEAFRRIEADVREVAAGGGFDHVCIPVSGLRGDNVTQRSERLPWYDGPTILSYLESVEIDEERMQAKPFRLPVQWVNRPDAAFRGFSGMIAGGVVRPGDPVRIAPTGRTSTVERIVTYDRDLDVAVAGQAVTLTLADEIDVSRGDVIAGSDSPPEVADQFEATIVWMADDPMLRGRGYLIRVGTRTVGMTIAPLKYKVNPETLEHVAATRLELNEIGVCAIELSERIAFDPYVENRDTGGFVVIDRITRQTVGAGLLRFALRRSHNVHWQSLDVDRTARASIKGQRPCVVWLTGLSGAGKSTIANLLERALHARGSHTYVLDGDNVRHGLNKDLGFTDADRVENIRRVAEVAKLMSDAGLIVIVAFISPFAQERRMARSLFGEGAFVEVFVDAPLELAEERDPKGLYRKARSGELANFTGIDSPYERPEAAEVTIDTATLSAEEAADLLVSFLARSEVIS
ncbi:MAG TPA: sulfate adenylyltransferase subunit CysN [Gaiellaceae bacterium]|nr:sulfate adenylyltransferase subunit CysN [Gaiellaceae bacterium]